MLKKVIILSSLFLFSCGEGKQTQETIIQEVINPQAQAIIHASNTGQWTILESVNILSIETQNDHINLYFDTPFTKVNGYSVTIDNVLAYDHYAASATSELDHIEIWINRDGLTGYYNPTLLSEGVISILVNGQSND